MTKTVAGAGTIVVWRCDGCRVVSTAQRSEEAALPTFWTWDTFAGWRRDWCPQCQLEIDPADPQFWHQETKR